jgi:hypothetical protein
MTRMKVISKDVYILIPLLVIIIIATAGILYLYYMTFERGLPITVDLVSGLLFLSWFVIIPWAFLIPMYKSVELFHDRFKVNYLFGLISYDYSYKDFRLSECVYRMLKGIVIENDEKTQLTFWDREYKNYPEIKMLLESKIIAIDKLEFKRISNSRTLITMFILFFVTLAVFVVSMKMGK